MAMIEVYKATSAYGSSCHFGVESAARAWAGTNGTVERIEVREPPVLTVVQCRHGQLARVCEMCDKDHEILRLTGEAAVMRSLLRRCNAVLLNIEPESAAEHEAIGELSDAVERAIGEAKGTLL